MNGLGAFLLIAFTWIMYQFVVKFVLPIYKTTRHIKEQFKNMAEQRKEQTPNNTEAPQKEKVGEYIDFEDVK